MSAKLRTGQHINFNCIHCHTPLKTLPIYWLNECSDAVKIFVNPVWTYNATGDINRHGSQQGNGRSYIVCGEAPCQNPISLAPHSWCPEIVRVELLITAYCATNRSRFLNLKQLLHRYDFRRKQFAKESIQQLNFLSSQSSSL